MQPVRVSITDLGATIVVLAWLPFGLTLGILSRWVQGRNDVSLKTDILLILARCTSGVPLSIKRLAVATLDVDTVLSSPRFRTVRQELCQHVQRRDFEGYWVCQGSLNDPKAASECDVVLFYIHGGAYVLGHPLMGVVQLLRVSELLSSKGLSVAIFSLRYGLAPETTFPKPFEQGLAAYQYLLEDLQVQPEKIIISGESAGGHLALTILHKLSKDSQNLPKPAGAALLYPWVDLSNRGDSFVRNRQNDVLQRHELDRAMQYACRGVGPAAFADIFDFSESKPHGYWQAVLPSRTWVGVGSHDLFVDSIEDFVQHAQDDGSAVKLDIYHGKPHGWIALLDVLSRRQYVRLDSEQDAEASMPGARLIANALLDLLDSPKI